MRGVSMINIVRVILVLVLTLALSGATTLFVINQLGDRRTGTGGLGKVFTYFIITAGISIVTYGTLFTWILFWYL